MVGPDAARSGPYARKVPRMPLGRAMPDLDHVVRDFFATTRRSDRDISAVAFEAEEVTSGASSRSVSFTGRLPWWSARRQPGTLET